MKNLFRKSEAIFAAAAFAEEGEFTSAKQIMDEIRTEKRERKTGRLERIMMAITFAEANERGTALEILNDEKRVQKRDRVEPRPRIRLRAK